MIDKNVANSYNQDAAQWVERLRSGNNPAHRFLEKPAMFGKLPDLTGQSVFCVGCGSAEEIGMLQAKGAQHIHAIDISESLIQVARETYPSVQFDVRSMEERQPFQDGAFDFIYSSLTLHYAASWLQILCEMRRLLKPGGRMLFSTHHPVKWGSEVTRGGDLDMFRMGYERPVGRPPTVFGDYLGTRRILDQWFGSMTVEYYHRPLEPIFRDILDAGFLLLDFLEPRPTPEAETEAPSFWAIHSRIPLFMIFELGNP
ncbi:MAG: class I SAM-dependent methyltransferase [Sulfuritalea sp.]|nr:class I SAM-dependent methyltransferase [Sulfuritalea sp.]